MKTRRQSLPRSERGALLIVAMLLSAVIGISLASYIRMSSGAMEISNRALFSNAAMNLAETGLEEAVWSINKDIDGVAGAWTGWTVSGNNASRGWSGYDLGANAVGVIRVYIQSYNGVSSAPIMVARSTITPPKGPAVEKWVEVTLVRRSLFANGLTARNQLTFNGNVEVDSYNSSLGSYNAVLADGTHNRYARGKAASTSTAADSFSSGQGDIWGYVAIGTPDLSGLDVGSNGTIGPFGTAAGTIVSERVSTDFTADFPSATAPTPAGTINSAPASWVTTLPSGTDIIAADGNYYYNVATGFSLTGPVGNKLTIAPNKNVILLFSQTTGTAISIGGNASISVGTNANLHIYTEANIAIAGNGVANANAPSNFQVWGTKTNTASPVQSISISGNGQLNATVYAPNSDVSVNGGGSSGQVSGAVVANNITLVGGAKFHYDEALADMSDGNPYGLGAWRELTTAAARAAYTANLQFATP